MTPSGSCARLCRALIPLAVVGLLVTARAGAAAESDVPVSIDLGAQGTAVSDGRRHALRMLGQRTDPRFLQRAGATTTFAVRLPPRDAVLELRSSPSVETHRVDVRIESDGAPPLVPAFEVTPFGDGSSWRASLADRAGEAVRVRIVNRSGQRLLWVVARIVGRGDAPAALLATPPPRSRPLNVVLYVIDTLRADHLTSYGYEHPTSPKLARLAQRAVLFERAYSAGPSTASSIPSLFGSRYPSELRARLQPNGPARRTLAEVFQKAGYETRGCQANFGLLGALGYERGFDEYRVLKEWARGGWRFLPVERVHDECLGFLHTRRGDRPFFLYVQTMDVHAPHEPHPRYRGRVHRADGQHEDASRALDALAAEHGLTAEQAESFRKLLDAANVPAYDEDVAHATHEFARFYGLLRRVGLLDDTLIVLTADHGEPLGEHGQLLHGVALYEEQVHVPLMIWMPGQPPGRRGEVVSLMDVAPTVLDLVGLPVPDSFAGASWLRGAPQIALGERIKHNHQLPVQAFVREGPWKLITGPGGRELYDLAADPDETRNLSEQRPILAEYLVAHVARHIPSHQRLADAPKAFDANLPDATRRELHDALRALGYLE